MKQDIPGAGRPPPRGFEGDYTEARHRAPGVPAPERGRDPWAGFSGWAGLEPAQRLLAGSGQPPHATACATGSATPPRLIAPSRH